MMISSELPRRSGGRVGREPGEVLSARGRQKYSVTERMSPEAEGTVEGMWSLLLCVDWAYFKYRPNRPGKPVHSFHRKLGVIFSQAEMTHMGCFWEGSASGVYAPFPFRAAGSTGRHRSPRP